MDTRKIYLTKITIAFGVSFLLMLWAISTASASSTKSEKPYRVETYSVSSPSQLKVKTSGGHITVKGSGSNEMRVEMYVSKNGKTLSPSDTNLDEFDIRIDRDGNQIVAIAERKGSLGWKFWNNNNISITFVVYTPTETSSDLKTSGGHITTSGLTGNQQIATSGGHLKLTDLQGTIHARTSGGHINIANVSGNMEARTSGGSISAKHTNGQLSVRTSGGSINLKDIAGAVEASTSGGGISADIVEMGEFATLKTSGGNVNITVPRSLGLNLDLHGSRVQTQLENFSGSMKDDDVEGTINGGGPMLSARTSGGYVRVSFR